MRKVTQLTAQALKDGEDLTIANTRVKRHKHDTACVSFYLHENRIAMTLGKTLWLSDAGWRTVTTKERLNGILKAFNTSLTIVQRSNQWYLIDNATGQTSVWTGETEMTVS